MVILRFLWYLVLATILTILTQVGGIIFFVALIIRNIWIKKGQARWKRTSWLAAIFSLLYAGVCFLILPVIAFHVSHRVPLPAFTSANVKPLSIWTCILNRHYVDSEMKTVILDTGSALKKTFPDHLLLYLDAGFPLINGFPLPPHLSHSDGQKVDLAFSYTNKSTGAFTPQAHTWLGYGGSEIPRGGESDMPATCTAKGFWQYSILTDWFGGTDDDLELDVARTTATIKTLAAHPNVRKIFLEPHLKQRWGLSSDKIRFHGCQAVRHDDHIHVQM